MKVRTDFVTNSSSSSFIIAKKHLDKDQIEAIRRHGELGEKMGLDCSDEPWHISEDEDFITGYTDMDNFDMERFLTDIDVSLLITLWSDFPFKLSDGSDSNVCDDSSVGWRKMLHEIQK